MPAKSWVTETQKQELFWTGLKGKDAYATQCKTRTTVSLSHMPSLCLLHLLLLGCGEAYLMVVRRGIWDDTELLSKTLQINSYTAMLLRFSSLTEIVTVYLRYLLVHSGEI